MTLLRSLCLGFAVTNALTALIPRIDTASLLSALVAGICVAAAVYRAS